jgi:cysteine synthase A
MSEERRLLMKKYGAELVLTAGALGMQGAVEKAQEIVENTPNAFLASQFENPANPLAHYQTTAPEIWEQTNGDIDIFVAGVGTGGTLTGVAKFLKERKAVQIVALEPKESPLLSTGKAGPHKIQGIGANFVPAVLDKTLIDEVLTVGGDDAIAMAKTLNEFEKAYVGISSGANVLGAIALAKREENRGKKIVTVFPDSGDRYASIF